MKLRNKKTGEILLIGNIIVENPKKIDCGELTKYSSLAELNDEWEDYKPKVFYYINENGGVLQYVPSDPEGEDETYIKYQKEIGNYFETKEEAEKAVEKLKALKRLKDKWFRFDGWTIDDGLRISICTNFDSDGIYDEYRKEVKKDLDACFGGEE
jgi:hypothetical protein